jgi:hypothetical protein
MRRWPQLLFSRAKRRMSCLTVGAVEGRPGQTAALGERPCTLDEFPVPAQQRDREDLAPSPARDQPRQRGQPDPIGWLVVDPRDLTAQHRVLVPERQHLRVLGHAAAQHGSGHHDQVPGQRGDDRQHHRRIIPDVCGLCSGGEFAGPAQNRVSERDKVDVDGEVARLQQGE